jgi:hypothetical protein
MAFSVEPSISISGWPSAYITHCNGARITFEAIALPLYVKKPDNMRVGFMANTSGRLCRAVGFFDDIRK